MSDIIIKGRKCDNCGNHALKFPCEFCAALFPKQQSQPREGGEHEPQLYAAQGLVTGNDGTFTVGFLGCSCGWNSDGKAEEKYSAHLRAGRQEQPHETLSIQVASFCDELESTSGSIGVRAVAKRLRAALAATPATRKP